jgi:hypothetical protein
MCHSSPPELVPLGGDAIPLSGGFTWRRRDYISLTSTVLDLPRFTVLIDDDTETPRWWVLETWW